MGGAKTAVRETRKITGRKRPAAKSAKKRFACNIELFAPSAEVAARRALEMRLHGVEAAVDAVERAVVELESTPRFQAYTSKFGSRPASPSALIIARRCVISLGNGKREKECQTDEGADPEPACYGPDEDGYVALAGRWKALVAAAKALERCRGLDLAAEDEEPASPLCSLSPAFTVSNARSFAFFKPFVSSPPTPFFASAALS